MQWTLQPMCVPSELEDPMHNLQGVLGYYQVLCSYVSSKLALFTELKPLKSVKVATVLHFRM